MDIMIKFKKVCNPTPGLVIDEVMTGFKGHFSLKQYTQGKQTKWRDKGTRNSQCNNGYLLRYKIYLGKKEKRNESLLLGFK
jgi:hypothetical protein